MYRIAAAASTLIFGVQGQGQILDTNSPDYQKKIKEGSHLWSEDPAREQDNMIGMCVYGAPNIE